ncbi:unnamed protein product [Acanthoscelides obtectus]|uniref:Uncharacterized protein n=1 Tax=Acanthoscelides obtectus TaxID=200917 RepID=A0A9P0LQG5_ACAOB|nr:unnamed protein product [Acanthoscelides obtectus]CAK1653155.1 hypothetical protein AOBTE_LOCUS18092 [Acanthoscelides obtectus]
MGANTSRMSRMIVDREPASHRTAFAVLYVDFLSAQHFINAAYHSNLLKTNETRLSLNIEIGMGGTETPPLQSGSPGDYYMFGSLT